MIRAIVAAVCQLVNLAASQQESPNPEIVEVGELGWT
jgi:hypothetical protein